MARAAALASKGADFHSREDVPASTKERSGASTLEGVAGRKRALERVKMDRARSPRLTSGSPARTRQQFAFHKDVARMRAALVSTQKRNHFSFQNEPHHLKKKYDVLSEPTKLWLVRVLSRLQYKHMRYLHASLVHGFNTWWMCTKWSRTEENLLEKYPEHIRQRWLKPVHAMRSRLVAYSIRMREAVIKVKVLRCWHEYVGWVGNSAHRKIAKRHWVRRLNRNVFRALKLWCDRSQKIRFMILQKTRHARRAQQRLWFTKWLQFTSRLKSDKRVAFMQRRYITKFFERRKWNQLRSHFDTLKHWYTSVKMDKAEEKNRMRLLKKVVGRFRHGRLGMTLRSWIEFVHLRRKYRRLAKNIFQHTLVHAFNRWGEIIAERKRLQRVGKRIIQRMLMRKLIGCFEVWALQAEESKRLKCVGQRVIKRFMMRALAASFLAWSESTQENKRLRLVCQKVVKRMLQKKMCACFSKWSDVIEETKRLRLVCQRVGARWLKASLVLVLHQWVAFVEQRRHDKSVVRRWLCSVENRELSSAVRKWKTLVREFELIQQQAALDSIHAKYAATEAAALQQRMKHVVQRFRLSRLSGAVAGWKDFIHLRQRYRRFAQKLFQHQLLAVFNTWYDWTIEAVRLRNVCQRVVKRMLMRQLAGCFSTWWETITEEIRLRNVCQRVVKRMLLRKLAGCFATWSDTVEENKRLKMVGQKVIKRMLMRQLSGCFSTWWETITEKIRLRNVCQRVVKRMLLRKLAGCFATWSDTVEENKRLKMVGQKVIKRMLMRQLSGCFSTWAAVVEETKRLNSVGKRVMKRMVQQDLSRCFLKWTDTIAETKRLRHIVKRVGARWHKAGLVATLRKWKDFIDERKEDQEIVRRWLLAVNNRETLSALRTWKAFVNHEIMQEQHNLTMKHEQERLLFEFAKRRRFRIMFRSVSRWQRTVFRHKKSQQSAAQSVTPPLTKEVDVDTLVELIGRLIVKKMQVEQAEQAVLAQRIKEAERAKKAEHARKIELFQMSETRMMAEQNTPIRRPQSSPSTSRSPRLYVPSKEKGQSQRKPKPWISSLSTSPSHSKVVAGHEKFMQAYRYRQKMYKGHDHGDRREQHYQTSGVAIMMSPEEKRNMMLKEEVQKFLAAITESFAQVKGHKPKRSNHRR